MYGGTGDTTYLHHILSQARDIASAARETQVFFGNYRDFMPTRVSYKLNLRGPAVGVQTACSTSLVAVITAAQALELHLVNQVSEDLDAGVQANLPTSAANAKDALQFNLKFWADQGEDLEKRFAAWSTN